MSSLFSMPDMPDPIVPPPPPTVDDAAAAQKASDMKRKRRGQQATILNSPTGINKANTGSPTLLGA